MRLSVFVPHSPQSVTDIDPYVAPIVDGHDGRLWLGQSMAIDPHQILSSLRYADKPVDTGTAVTLAPLRHPLDAAVAARSVSLCTGGVHVAGFGAGSRRFQSGLLGEPYRSPLTAMSEYLSGVRSLIDDDSVDTKGDYFSFTAALPPITDIARVEVAAGVLRAGMARVTGRYADAAVTWLTPPDFIRDELIPAMVAGSLEEQRSRPPRAVSVVHAIVDRRGRDPVHQVMTASRAHLGMPHYRKMLLAAGIPITGDLVMDAALLIEHGVYCFGSPEDIVEQLGRWSECGVDEVALNLAGVAFTVGESETRTDLEDILGAWAARHG